MGDDVKQHGKYETGMGIWSKNTPPKIQSLCVIGKLSISRLQRSYLLCLMQGLHYSSSHNHRHSQRMTLIVCSGTPLLAFAIKLFFLVRMMYMKRLSCAPGLHMKGGGVKFSQRGKFC